MMKRWIPVVLVLALGMTAGCMHDKGMMHDDMSDKSMMDKSMSDDGM